VCASVEESLQCEDLGGVVGNGEYYAGDNNDE
jgi:hypothetical protein